MFYPCIEDVMRKTGIKTHYLLTLIAAKRARVISMDPSRRVINAEAVKPLSIALREIEQGLVEWELPSKASSKKEG